MPIDETAVRTPVRDYSVFPPVLAPGAVTGLLLVDRLADSGGHTPHPDGKTTCARLDRPQ